MAGYPAQFSETITAPANVKRLVALFNSLEIVQPAINCLAGTVEPIVTVTFRCHTR